MRRSILLLARPEGGARTATAQEDGARGTIGVYTVLDEPETTAARIRGLGLRLAEIYTDETSPEAARKLREALERHGVSAAAIFAMGPGPAVWDFHDGPATVGLVPREWRRRRIDALKRSSDFAKLCGSPALETHCGFIPECPKDPLYPEAVEAIREIARHCGSNGQTFLYHTGQESPVTLLRTILDVGLDNQGIGLDTANPILYDRGHPTYALDVYSKHVRVVNVKDGLYPTDPKSLGKEVPVGEGRVDFPRFFARLRETGFDGPVIIERESAGTAWAEEIRKSARLVESLWRK